MGGIPSTRRMNSYSTVSKEAITEKALTIRSNSIAAQNPLRVTVDGLSIVTTNPEARDSFVNYIKSNSCESAITTLLYLKSLRSMNAVEMATWADKEMSLYIKPRNEVVIVNRVRANANSILINDFQLAHLFDHQLQLNINDIITLLIIRAIPDFCKSCDFKFTREKDFLSPIMKEMTRSSIATVPSIANAFSATCSQYIYEDSIASVSPAIINETLQLKDWLEILKSVLDNLPVSVSLADADSCNPGFPLIFVNKYFENMSGFTFDEIRGKSNRFLQGPETESDSVQRLTNALVNAKPVKVTITNYTKSGTMFRNLLSMSPVFDRNGKYCFVLGVQFNCSRPGATVDHFAFAQAIINVLPKACPFWMGFI